MPKSKGWQKNKHASASASVAAYESGQMAGVPKASLEGYKPLMWPTVLPVRLVYTDYRVLTAIGNQASYVYRLNSVFDPDQTGVGGQPAGFDQLKTLYGRYRVMAVKVEVEAAANATTGSGLLAIAPSDSAVLGLTAEDTADLRFAKSVSYTQSQVGKLSALYHIGELLGYSDQSMLANTNVEAATTTSPAFQQYLIVAVETGNSATQQTMTMVRLTYYVRMEVPIAVDDAVSKHVGRARLNAFRLAPANVSATPVPGCMEGRQDNGTVEPKRAAEPNGARVLATAELSLAPFTRCAGCTRCGGEP